MLESYYKLQPKLSQVYRCTLDDLVCFPEKAIDNAVKDNCNWLQACVSAMRWKFWTRDVWQFV